MTGMFCKRFGVGKASKHYGVGHGAVPCRPLFVFFVYSTIVPRLLATSPREQVLRVVTGTQELLRRQIMAVTSYYIILYHT